MNYPATTGWLLPMESSEKWEDEGFDKDIRIIARTGAKLLNEERGLK